MADAPQNAKGEGIQSTCASCGEPLKMGWTNSSPRRAILLPCAACETKAAALRCPTCGGTGRAPAASETPPTQGAA